MKPAAVLAVIIYAIAFETALTVSDLVSRQECDSISCIDWLDVGIGTVEGLKSFFQPGQDLTVPETDEKDNTPSQTPPDANPSSDIELKVVEPAVDTDGCVAAVQDLALPGVPGIPAPQQCSKSAQYLIWPNDCKDLARNQDTGKKIAAMDARLLTSTNPLCPAKGGVFFWLAELTPQQVDLLRKDISSVKSVVRNGRWCFGGVGESSSRSNVPASRKRSYLQKRTRQKVVKQVAVDQSLSFLSTAPWKQNSDKYTFFPQAGEHVRVFVIEKGLDPTSAEFFGREVDWIYAFDATRDETDDLANNPRYSGTCVLSRIAGREFGVAKKAQLTMVKARSGIASVIDALVKIILSLMVMNSAYTDEALGTRGWTVINLAGGYDAEADGTSDYLISQLSTLLFQLQTEFQTVVVTSSGVNEQQRMAETNTFPAVLSPYNPGLMTVGAVAATVGARQIFDEMIFNGERFSWSPGGNAVQAWAPGNAPCRGPKNVLVEEAIGANISTATVTGLVAYFLSLPDLGWTLRMADNVPTEVVNYVQQMSYKRYSNQESVWNGLDNDQDPSQFLIDWHGIPPSKDPPPMNLPQ